MAETIEVRYKEIGYEGSGVFHKYIIYTDDNGDKWYARGGPESAASGLWPNENRTTPFGRIVTEYGAYTDSTVDWDDPVNGFDQSESIFTDSDLSSEWALITGAMDEIESQNHIYTNYHNSNSAVDTALLRAGLTQPSQDDRDENFAPGSGFILPDSLQPDPNPIRDVPAYIGAVASQFGTAVANGSPIVLDIDHSGTIDLVSLNNSTVYWDIDGDGFGEHIGWVAPEDGLLAIDANSNGIIDGQSELFGTVSENGYLILDDLDTNTSNTITSADTDWSDLRVWIDTNQNGVSDSGELHTMGDLGITSISLGTTTVSQTNEGHTITHVSTFTDGAGTHATADVWFQYDNVNTVYTQTFDANELALFLPELRGYGEVPDLAIAMSLDDDFEDAQSLLSQVHGLFMKDINELFADGDATHDLVTAIMYRWAGVDGVSPTSRGGYVDARKLEFLEALMGEGVGGNPNITAGPQFHEAFEMALNGFYARLLAQTDAAQIFQGDLFYNIATDEVVGITGLDTTALANFGDIATASLDPAGMWMGVVRMIEHTVGTANLSGGDFTALEDEIANSGSDLTLTQLLDALDNNHAQSHTGTSSNETFLGSGNDDYVSAGAGDDLVYGFAGDDEIYGENGNDTLFGYGGNDYLNGGNNDDTIFGGAGDDEMHGGSGVNTFYAGSGDDEVYGGSGNDTFNYESGDDEYSSGGSGGTDVIKLPDGIDSGDLTFARQTNGTDLLITIGTIGSIYLHDQFYNNNYKFETIQFFDTTTLDLSTVNHTISGTASGETLNGVATGGGTNDTMYGLGGNDRLNGGAGNDFLYGGDGNDELYGDGGNNYYEGGAGNDWMQNLDPGNDTYVYSGGLDTIYDDDGSDILRLTGSWTINDIVINDLGSHHKIVMNSGVDEIELRWFDSSAAYKVETIEFADGFKTTLNDHPSWMKGTSGNDTVTGNASHNTLVGYAGNDTLQGAGGADDLHGGSGDDTLEGGAGDDLLHGGADDDLLYGDDGIDTLYGGTGADTFVFESATVFGGDDVIMDFSTAQGDAIDIADVLSGYDPMTDLITDFVQITDSGADSILAIDWDGGANNFVEVATIKGVTGLTDEAALETGGYLIAA